MLIFTRTKVFSHLPNRNWKTSRRYVVLGMDETSVAIIKLGELDIKNRRQYWQEGLRMIQAYFAKPEIQHIHFDKNHFWISIGIGRNREFFRKLKK